MVHPSTLLTQSPWQCICIGMFPSWPVHNVKVVLLQFLQPPGQLSLWLLERLQPGQRTMIRPESKLPAQQIGAELLREHDYNSERVTQYRRSDLLRVRLANAITCSLPSSSSWDNTPPIPVLLASVSKRNGLVKSGNTRTCRCSAQLLV